jgi:phosphate transport system permease protein
MATPLPTHVPLDIYQPNVAARKSIGRAWQTVFLAATCVGILGLFLLMYNVINNAFGIVAYADANSYEQFSPVPVDLLADSDLIVLLTNELSKGAITKLNTEKPLAERSRAELLSLVYERILERKVVASSTLTEAIFGREAFEAAALEKDATVLFTFRSWVSPEFLTEPMSAMALFAGVRTAILGSLMLIGLTILIALPIGTGAAIYLQEYADKSLINQIIETNIYNLAGVPSIVYGMLGLAVFVRALEPLTSGGIFGNTDSNGRTVLSAALTMALLVLPLIIVNAQEALKAVPDSLRQAAYGVGATRWQTIWHHVLPQAIPGVLTGSILAVSRAIGETAPLIVVGASTFITADPTGPFSGFTALPIQIYNWTVQPQTEFHNLAGAAILVLLILLLTLNASAILLRNRLSARRVI